jgi:transcriptional regulator with XRE-family HTH domain
MQPAAGVMLSPVAREIEFRRRRRGITQRQLGALVGRSQGQIANYLWGRDPLSAAITHRLREILLGAPAQRLVHYGGDDLPRMPSV